MIEIVKQTLDFYFQKLSAPGIEDIPDIPTELQESTGSCFVTLFLYGEVRGSAGNIKKTWVSLAEELIINTVNAISLDSRFPALTIGEKDQIKLRVDNIISRKIFSRSKEDAKNGISVLSKIDPVKNGILVIKKDYTKSATILPNIDPKIIIGTDYAGILWGKLDEEFKEDDYIIYELETTVETDF